MRERHGTGRRKPLEPPGPERLELAFDLAQRSIQGEYLDVHCWTFTLASFARLMRELGRLGLCTLACTRAFDMEIGELEFIVIMQPGEQTEVTDSWTRICDEAKPSTSMELETWPDARRRWLNEGRRAEITSYEVAIEQLRRDLADTRDEVAAIQQSTSWRITGPLRGAVQRLRGLSRHS